MTDVQFKMLEILVNEDKDANNFITYQTTLKTIEREYLNEYALGLSDIEIDSNFTKMVQGGYVEMYYYDNNEYKRTYNYIGRYIFILKLPNLGLELYNIEKQKRSIKIKREERLYNAQLRSFWAGTITLTFIIVNTGFSIASYFTTAKISVEQIDKLTQEVQFLRFKSQSYKSIHQDSSVQNHSTKP